MAPCELSGDQGTHVYPPPRAKTGILFIQCKVHVNEHARRPRGSQSGREKGRDDSFKVQAKEPLGTDSHQTISKNSSS